MSEKWKDILANFLTLILICLLLGICTSLGLRLLSLIFD